MEETGAAQEALIAEWEQPLPATAGGSLNSPLVLSGAVILALALGFAAYWFKELNYGLAGAVIVVAMLALRSQNRTAGLPVAVTNVRIVLGKREHPLSDFSGFWLGHVGDVIEINLETKRASLLPITILAASSVESEVRTLMSQALPEVEPRAPRMGDKLSRYFRL